MGEQTDRAGALAAFDRARDAFLAAFAAAPDAALPYVPAGEEYALGVLPMHLEDPMRHYLAVFDYILAADFGAVDLAPTPEAAPVPPERHAEIVATRPTGADRRRLLEDLAARHAWVRERVSALDEATFARQAPVIFAAGSEPYPTSCRDIMGWLADHYDEHTAQVGDLLAQWRAEGNG